MFCGVVVVLELLVVVRQMFDWPVRLTSRLVRVMLVLCLRGTSPALIGCWFDHVIWVRRAVIGCCDDWLFVAFSARLTSGLAAKWLPP